MREATTHLRGYDPRGQETPLTLITGDTSAEVRVIVGGDTEQVPVQLDLDHVEVDRLIESLRRWRAWRGERSGQLELFKVAS